MKKRVLSLFMALMLCLTLLPTAALADELGSADGTSAVETADSGSTPAAGETGGETEAEPDAEPDAETNADAEAEAKAKAEAEAEAEEKAEAEAKAKADAEAAAAVQAQIDALPSADELPGMSGAARDAAYLVALSVYDAYEDLTAEQQAQVSVEKLTALLGWFSSQVATLADEVTGIWLDEVDLKTGEMTQGKQNWTATPLGDSNGNLTLTGGNMYVVGENQEVTIDGDLTMAGNSQNYLILFNGAKLIINGALILEQNGLNIYSHTALQDLDTIGQITINNSKEPSGAAIRSSTVDARTLNLYGGKLTANGGEYGAVSNVYLYRGTAPYPLKAALDGKLLPLEDWAFTAVDSPANKDLVIEWCTHPDEYDSYVDNKDGSTHHLKCNLCGFEWLKENQAADTESKIGHFLTYTILNDTYHKGTCRECGAEIAQEKHESMKDPDGNPVYSPTLDGKGHVSGACACGYSSGTVADHNYSDYGACTGCGFTPVAKDTNGNLYDDIEEAIENGATELWLVSEATGASQNILQKSLKIDEGVNLTLHMNDVKLEGIAGSPALTVSGGTLTVQGEANIVSPDVPGGTTEFSAAPAVKVTSGSLIFEDAVTATGGKYSNKVASAIEVSGGKLTFNGEVNAKAESIDTAQPSGYTLAPAINVTGGEVTFAQKLTATGGIFKDGTNLSKQEPAVYATSGTLDFKGDLDLNGGLTLTKSAKLANLLTQGTFSVSAGTGSSPLSVKDSSVYKKVSDLLAEGYAYALKNDNSKFTNFSGAYTCSDDVTIVKHEHEWKLDSQYPHLHSCACGKSENHEYDSSTGKCKICQSECSHKDVDNDGTCFTCKAHMAVKITASNNTVTYGTDFKSAMRNATNGTKITLLADVSIAGRAGISGDNTTVTLDLNEHKITSGWLDVGGKDTNGTYTACTLKIIGKGSYEPPMYGGIITVDLKATLDLSDWEGGTISTINISDSSNYDPATREAAVIVGPKAGTIGKLSFGNNQLPKITKTKLSGGSFNEIWVADFGPVKLGELLADGYAFQNGDGSYVEYGTPLQGASIYNVKVVPCTHSKLSDADADGNSTCVYCNKTGKFVAAVDTNLYDNWDTAFTAWLANGGTLKLYNDYEATASANVTWYIGTGSHSIDLNGHKMTVPTGYAFVPDHGMDLTIQDTSEKKNGTISSILDDGDFWKCRGLTLESGCIENLKVTNSGGFVLKGGSIGTLTVESYNNISLSGGSIGAYSLPAGTVLADVVEHQYYAEGTGLDKSQDTANGGSFAIKMAPSDFGPDVKAANVPIDGKIPFTVDAASPGDVGDREVQWYLRTGTGAEAIPENKVTGAKVGDKLNVFCVITGKDGPSGGDLWQVALMGRTLTVVPASLKNDGNTTIEITNANDLVYTGQELTANVKVTYNGKELEEGADYTVSDNTETNAGTHTLTVTGKGNYTDTVEEKWTIAPHTIGVPRSLFTITKTYDGTATVSTDNLKENSIIFKSTAGITGISEVTLTKGTDFTISGSYDGADVNTWSTEITITLKDGGNYTFSENRLSARLMMEGTITKATAGAAKAGELTVVNNLAKTYDTVDLTALLPALPDGCKFGNIQHTVDQESVNALANGYNAVEAGFAAGKNGNILLHLVVPAVGTDIQGPIGAIKVTVTTQNYEDITLTVNVSATNKIIPTGAPTPSKTAITYGQALSAIKLSGSMKEGDKAVPGEFTWTQPDAAPVVGEYIAEWKFTPEDTATYLETTGTVTITVNKAKPTGEPVYTKITAAKKTLADANLKPNTSWPTGTIQWVDKDGKELPDTTEVKANTEYQWKFIPADTANYNEAVGTLTLWARSSGGGGGGGGAAIGGTTAKTDTVTNPDGSVTKTETKADGTVVETTTGKDGSTTVTETKKDGSSVTESKDANGSTGTVKTDKNGQTEASAKISDKAVSDAKNSGDAVKVPTEVRAGTNSNSAPTVKIDLPANSGETKIEIPVDNVNTGTVAVIVHPDGTEEIMKDSIPTENGVQLTVSGDATVKVLDNSKNFTDTPGHWSEKNIDFVSARGLLNGTSANTFSPNAPTTRAQLWTVLARQADADLSGGANWFEKAQAWSKDNGISDGTNPSGTISRAQMVTMLWRAAGSPEPKAAAGRFSDVMDDSYYADAVAWAVENGITTGTKDGRFDPYASCTRAQIAAFLYRLYVKA